MAAAGFLSEHDWYNKGRGMCNSVCGIVHIKKPLAVNRKE